MRVMTPRRVRSALIALVMLAFGAGTGCSLVFPAHPNAYDLDGEAISLRLLKAPTPEDRADCDHLATLNVELPEVCTIAEGEEFAFAAPLAAAAVGFAIDFIKKRMAEEANRYESSFGKRIPGDGFWKFDAGQESYAAAYVGFEMVRGTRAHPAEIEKVEAESGAADTWHDRAAFRLVCLFESSMDESLFLIRPVYLLDQSTRAKVLWKVALPSWFNWFMKAVDQVDVDVQVAMDAIWVDEERRAHNERIASFPMKFAGVGLSEPAPLRPPAMGGEPGGWFPGPPRTANAPRSGAFWLSVDVVERDPSNAKKYLERAVEEVGKRRDDVVQKVSGAVGGGED